MSFSQSRKLPKKIQKCLPAAVVNSNASMASRAEVLWLYRSLLRTARDFCDYNIREYTKRRTIDGFRQNKNLTDPSAVSAAFNDGKAQLEVAKRQAIVYSLYEPKIKSIMETNKLNKD